jgi:hypothetical protein
LSSYLLQGTNKGYKEIGCEIKGRLEKIKEVTQNSMNQKCMQEAYTTSMFNLLFLTEIGAIVAFVFASEQKAPR